MRLHFLGTPEFAVPSLQALVEDGHEIWAVYTQPDRPKGRGQHEAASPVKQAALALGLTVRQPVKIRQPEVAEELRADGVDAMVVVGYGQILPQRIIDLAPRGIINVHGSLLPKYRGAAPIQWAIANGEQETGVTTMRIDAGLDTGAMLAKAATAIGPDETALEVGPRLARMGATLLVQTMRDIAQGREAAEPQNNADATYAPILKKEDGLIDWNRSAQEIHNRVRGFLPWPGAYSYVRSQRIHFWKTKVSSSRQSLTPGELFASKQQLLCGCGDGTVLELLELQLEGKKRVSSAAFLNGHRLVERERLGEYTS